ncbi:hypothetical protein ENUP19_0047G0098 [Entamoeba nuttalli]|uniref:DNA-directed RNA polymerase III subunit RPC3 n=2 Tax=Entamoeba nuttalli TaxID=412467 RepID=K2I1L6_ENTNP|nr:RNA polymerase III subunit, putative [Entamoeba nuttalli P19]EKE42630.1 RNA polymerase III subunit, putative [Entamoeba nuttalli P19]|eukprot:XP_008855027.1 RNA polymerase III subunit, putative [Entamoeba nuttalli P19]
MNTTIYNQLLVQIVENQFGKFVGQITKYLLVKPSTIFDLWRQCHQPYSKMYEALFVLLHHSILKYSNEEPVIISIDQNRILFSLRHSHFIALMQQKFGELAKEISITLITYGMLNFEDIFAVLQSKNIDVKESDLKAVFDEMVKEKYITRVNKNVVDLVQLERTSTPAPSFSTVKQNENVRRKGIRKRGKIDVVTENPIPKKVKVGIDLKAQTNLNSTTKAEDSDNSQPVWTVNIEVYNKETILYKLLDLVNKKFDNKAVPIIEKMWDLSAYGKTPVDFAILCQNLREIAPETIRKYLEMMSRDEPFIIAKNQSAFVSDTNSFKLQVDAATAFLKGVMIESCIQSKFGVIGASIHRVLKIKHILTDSQIADLLIGEGEEVKRGLYQMHQAGYINGQEVPKSNIRGGKNSYYMWSINFSQINAILLSETAKSLMNTMDRLKLEISSKSALIAKYNEGVEIGQILLNEEENEEYMNLDRRQKMLLDGLYYLSGLFFCLKDY